MQDALENVFAQREKNFYSCPSRPTVLYVQLRHDVRFIDWCHLLQQTFKEKLPFEIIPKEEQG